jgi:hypothetical protein
LTRSSRLSPTQQSYAGAGTSPGTGGPAGSFGLSWWGGP